MNLGDRILKALEKKGIPQEDLGALVGVTQQAISLLIKGKTKQPRNINKIAQVLDTTPSFLLYGNEEKEESTENIIPYQDIIRLPLYDWEIINGNSVKELYQIDKEIQMINIILPTLKISASSFCLRVKDDSMTSKRGISFPKDSIIIVDPTYPYKDGSFVLAEHLQTKRKTFKQYVLDGGEVYLLPLNDQFPIINFNNYKIVGTIRSIVPQCIEIE